MVRGKSFKRIHKFVSCRELDIIPLLVQLLLHPDEDCHRNAAGALKNLSYGKYLDDNKVNAPYSQ